MSPTRRAVARGDNPVKALLRSGARGILAVTLAVVIAGAAAAVIAFAVAVAF
jgi:hypothetical protein